MEFKIYQGKGSRPITEGKMKMLKVISERQSSIYVTKGFCLSRNWELELVGDRITAVEERRILTMSGANEAG